jgi:hypothetical protein
MLNMHACSLKIQMMVVRSQPRASWLAWESLPHRVDTNIRLRTHESRMSHSRVFVWNTYSVSSSNLGIKNSNLFSDSLEIPNLVVIFFQPSADRRRASSTSAYIFASDRITVRGHEKRFRHCRTNVCLRFAFSSGGGQGPACLLSHHFPSAIRPISFPEPDVLHRTGCEASALVACQSAPRLRMSGNQIGLDRLSSRVLLADMFLVGQ